MVKPTLPKPTVVQRVSVTIVPQATDEASVVVGSLKFGNRPPVNKKVKEEVDKLNSKGKSKWQVGHIIGWELIAADYERKFVGKTIGDLDTFFKSLKYGCSPTISIVERCIGMWIDSDYQKTYATNEFPQEARENMSAGGSVPHLKQQYQSDYDKGIRSKSSKEHRQVKRDYVASQVNLPEKMETDEQETVFTQTESLWNSRYPASPLREKEFYG